MTRTRSTAAATATDGRTLDVVLVPFDAPRRVTDDGRTWYREAFRRGGVRLADLVPVVHEHGGPTIGRVVAVHERADGLHATIRVADTTAGRDVLALADEGVMPGVSIEFDDFDDTGRPPADDELVVRSNVTVWRVAITERPQHHAPILARRAEPAPDTDEPDDGLDDQVADDELVDEPEPEEEPTMTDELTPTEPDPTAPDPDDTDDTAAVLTRSAPTPRGGARTTARPAAPVGRFRSFGDYVRAVAGGELDDGSRRLYERALADVTSGDDVPGLHPEAWVREIVDLMGAWSPTVSAFRSAPLPESGMVVMQPIVRTRVTVGKQANEKTQITSTKPSITPEAWPVETFAGGNDVSLQTILRSDPSTIAELMRQYAAELAVDVNADLVGKIEAELTTPTGVTAATLIAGFTTAAKTILTTLRRFPEVAVLGVDVWEAMANAVGTDGRPLFPNVSPSNPVGEASIVDGQGNVRGLTYYVDPALTPTLAVVGVRDAVVSRRGPVGTLAADVPAKLGRDVAAYQFAAQGVVDARGLVALSLGAGTGA